VNHIPAEDQGDTQTGFGDCYFLEIIKKVGKNPLLAIIAGRGTVGVQTGTDLTLAYQVMVIRSEVEPLGQLPGFFFQGHATQEIFDTLGNGDCGFFIGWNGHGYDSLQFQEKDNEGEGWLRARKINLPPYLPIVINDLSDVCKKLLTNPLFFYRN
jgi:hypothetical protein